MRLTLLFALALSACGGSSASSQPPEPPGEQALPPARDVCVRLDDGSLAPGSAIPSRAGVYDPAAPIDPTLLNWMVGGQGCVEYPGSATDHGTCGDSTEQRPIVGRTLCGQ